jgi:type III restriction enzyme
MKLQFKRQSYQAASVEAVVDCFQGQPKSTGVMYRVDPGARNQSLPGFDEGFKNASIGLPLSRVLENLQSVKRRQNFLMSTALISSKVCPINLDIEMETGTGKTYCYIKTMFEMQKQYGWSKFIVVVPSIAIREGVRKSFEITADHFLEEYGKRARVFICRFRLAIGPEFRFGWGGWVGWRVANSGLAAN